MLPCRRCWMFFFRQCVITTSGESQTDASPPPLLRVSHHTQPAAAFIIRAQIMANRSPCCNCSHDHNPGGRGEGLATHILLCVLRRFDLADTSQGRPFNYVTKTGLVLVFSSQTKFLFFKKNGLRPYDTSPRLLLLLLHHKSIDHHCSLLRRCCT